MWSFLGYCGMDLFEANEGSFYLTYFNFMGPNGGDNMPMDDDGARVGNDCCNAPNTNVPMSSPARPNVCSGDTYSSQVLYINFRKHCGRSFNGFTTPATLPANTRSLSGVVSSKYI